MALVEPARFQTKVEADLARLLLEAEGFGPVLFDENMNYIGLGSIMPIRLMVVEEEYMQAAEVLVDEGLL
jgi:Putative prokaryotic signal transducing protein